MDEDPGSYEELEIDLREYIMLLWRAKWFIGALIILAAIGAFVFTITTTEVQHKATADVLLMPPRHTEIDVSRMGRSTYANLAQSDDIRERIIEELDLRDEEEELLHPSDIEGKMDLQILEDEEVQEEEESFIFRMEVTSTDPEEASDIANAWAEFFQEDTLEIRRGEIEDIFEVTERRFEETEANLEQAEERLEELKKEARLDRLTDEKESYRENLREIEDELLSLQEELGAKESEKEHIAEALAEMEEDEIWEEEFYRALEQEEIADKTEDLLNAQQRLAAAREEYRIDLLELQRDQLEDNLEHYRDRLSDLEQKEADGQRQELLDLEDEIARQEAELETIRDELTGMETEDGIWLGERSTEEMGEMRPDMQEAVENYRQKRDELFAFWEEYDLVGKQEQMEFLRELTTQRREIVASLEEKLAETESDFSELEEVLAEEPEKQRLEKSLTEDAFWENIFSPEELEIMTDLVMEEERINPVYETLRQERANVRVQLVSIPQQIDQFENEIEEIGREKEELRSELNSLEQKESDLQEDLELYESMYTDWEDTFRDLKREEIEQEREISALETRLQMLEEYENPRIQAQKSHYKTLIAEKESEISTLSQRINTYRDEVALLEQDVQHYQELYDHKASEYRQLKNSYFDLGIEIEHTKNMIEYYSSRRSELSEEVEHLEEQVWQYERRMENITREVDRYESSYDRLSSEMEDARLAMAEQTSDVRFVSAAVPPGRTIGRGTTLNVAIAVVLAGMLGVFIVFFREFMKIDENE
ncbi:Wzz/FepE/Etk N-terminal domain-containing protein [Halarsenatibacter silvermanii]|uniref:Uncharacterized protein involved in exopolysaccharide biosynthesis n=1 Tax=Halarsenatibacter silvermanii TaxID=321763 RepID=A0A1G9HBG1_9FIRM|nr:Wzz/FepE/Etk N-terminal domain-containing protein [Halarsenatibacter silvermanii]SDL10267.1 Uncharacterized protein involved in exopolysaccharide biosynthesis [Halarsenatibacter silvermanii]